MDLEELKLVVNKRLADLEAIPDAERIDSLNEIIETIHEKKMEFIQNQDFELAADSREIERKVIDKRDDILKSLGLYVEPEPIYFKENPISRFRGLDEDDEITIEEESKEDMLKRLKEAKEKFEDWLNEFQTFVNKSKEETNEKTRT